jgi:hypothetical protein
MLSVAKKYRTKIIAFKFILILRYFVKPGCCGKPGAVLTVPPHSWAVLFRAVAPSLLEPRQLKILAA